MGLPQPEIAAMEVSIACNQLDILQYSVQAVACLRSADAPPPASTTARDGPVPAYGAHAGWAREMPAGTQPAWSAALRALRERTLAEIEAQRARFILLTGRDWQLADVDFEAPASLPGAGEGELRIALVARVVLRACTPTLH